MIIDGFTYAAVEAGIRKTGRLDLGLIYSETPATAAGVFTTNRVKAAPVILDMARLGSGRAQAILINSGVANACTGLQGEEAALACGALVSSALAIPEDLVLLSSTGVIGEQLRVDRFAKAMAGLAAGLSPAGFEQVARAMMTTDTVPKTAGRKVSIAGCEVKIFGMAKGAGMIMPDMATMLCFVMSDVKISTAALNEILKKSAEQSFNRIIVDGDTSTNDMVLSLCNGRAVNPMIDTAGSEDGIAFGTALGELLLDLALQIVKDGEGATKLVAIRIKGARDEREAKQAARTIANSALVKTAFFGEDANWGRIIAALGRAGIEVDQDRVDISFDDVLLVKDGLGLGAEAESRATAVLKKPEFSVNIDLKLGSASCEVYTCDLSIDYIKINADYRS